MVKNLESKQNIYFAEVASKKQYPKRHKLLFRYMYKESCSEYQIFRFYLKFQPLRKLLTVTPYVTYFEIVVYCLFFSLIRDELIVLALHTLAAVAGFISES